MLRKTILALTAAALALPGLAGANLAVASEVQPNLVGGREATGNTSWMVSVREKSDHICGGVLLFGSWVATNAHCVDDPPGSPVSEKAFTVRVGSKDRTRGGEIAKVLKVVIHPGWKWAAGAPAQAVNDVAMLKLDRRVNAQPIQLAGQAARPGDRIRLYGWGADQPDGDPTHLPKQLQQLDTTVLSPDRCEKGAQSAGEICTNNPHGTDGPGAGDSGGPAVATVNGTPQLVGTCSRPAGPRLPGVSPTVYTSSPDFRTWLYDTARGAPAVAA